VRTPKIKGMRKRTFGKPRDSFANYIGPSEYFVPGVGRKTQRQQQVSVAGKNGGVGHDGIQS
jgi:hypothetical protein